jgi:hypothetical protein
MADTLYTRALIRAADIHGSTQSLASYLRVPENTLVRWMSGRAQMPLQAFLRVIALVSEDERKQAVGALSQSAARAEKLGFRIGELEAHCARCEGVEFVQAEPGLPLRYINVLHCAACGERVIHGDLIARLAKDAVYHSRALTAQRQKRQAEVARKVPRLQALKAPEAPLPSTSSNRIDAQDS